MKLCELCGSKEETVMVDGQEEEEVNLHICQSCQNDRKYNPLNWIF